MSEMQHVRRGEPARGTRAPAPVRPASAAAFALPRGLGNQAYGQLVQPRLKVGAPGDRYEQEADRVADTVVRGGQDTVPVSPAPVPAVRRMCAECEKEAHEEGQGPVPEDFSIDGQEEDEERALGPAVQRSPGGVAHAPPPVAAGIARTQGRGEALPAATRNDLGARMGADFGGVRVHHDAQAADMCGALNAHAFTVGRDIWFNQGRYAPESPSGTHLLAHELTHTLQQTGTIQRLTITPTKTFTQGKCGERSVYWNFTSGVAAPASGGYIVQHVRSLENITECPSGEPGSISLTPKEQFWEAWWVAPGDTIQELHKNGGVDFTDRSARPGTPGKSGAQVSLGTVKFFGKNTTGDLGKEGVLSSDAAIAANWKPGNQGGVPQAGWLPSTRSEPSWWGSQLDGPASRWANSWWSCCGADETKHTSSSDASPK